jgi:hypothetical protein
MTKKQRIIWIGSIILLAVIPILIFSLLGLLIILKQMKVKTLKTFGNGKDKLIKIFVERRRQLRQVERMATSIGYMGAGFLVAAQWTLEPVLYILGFVCVMIQVRNKKTMEFSSFKP